MLMEPTIFATIIATLTLIFGLLTKVIGFPDQIRKNFKRKSTDGLSSIFIGISFLAYTLWTVHVILQQDFVLVIGQGLGIVTTGIILLQIFVYKNKDK